MVLTSEPTGMRAEGQPSEQGAAALTRHHGLFLMGFGTFGTLLVLGLISWLIGYLHLEGPLPSLSEIQSRFAVSIDLFAPEPLERLRYVALVLLVVPSLLAFQLLGRYILRRYPGSIEQVMPAGHLLAVGLLLLALADFSRAPFVLAGSALVEEPRWCVLTALLIVGVGWGEWRMRPGRLYAWGMALLPAAMAVLLAVKGIFSVYRLNGDWSASFNAVFDSVAQVANGRAILIDFFNQYGLYPYFLEPLWHWTGCRVLGFTAIMAALVLLCFGSLYVSLRRAQVSPLVTSLGLLAVMFYSGALIALHAGGDQYFQYLPLRMVFPCLVVACAAAYFYAKGPKAARIAYWAGHVLAALAPLWNLDSGTVTLGAWLSALAFAEFLHQPLRRAAWRALTHGAIGGAVFGGVLATFVLTVRLRYGVWPDLAGLLAYSRYFYISGLMMLPMPAINPWNLVALCYLGGLSFALQAAFRKGADRSLAAFVAFLSVLGIGLFSYYQGRSHDLNLLHVSYPSILLVAIAADRLWRQPKPTMWQSQYARNILLTAAVLFFTNATASLFLQTPALAQVLQANLASLQPTPGNGMAVNLEFIRRCFKPGQPVLILSHDSGAYYAETGTYCPLSIPGASELVLQTDVDQVRDYLARGKGPVLLDAIYQALDDPNADLDLGALIHTHFRRVAASPDGRLTLFRPAGP